MEALEILESYKSLVWPEIQKYLKDPVYPKAFRIPKKYEGETKKYWQVVKDYPERQGKYLRPTILLLTCQAMNGDLKKALKTAAAMQLSEDWLLIHDDLQDHSLLRRGKPALHRLYGEELALNAGDTLQVIMWKIILDNKNILGSEKTYEIADEFYKVLKRTADGQAIEVSWAKGNKFNFCDNDWYFIADGKTAYYTVAAPLRLGAMVADATHAQLEILAKFGLLLGRSFQLVDDILDLTKAYKGSGQQIGGDVYESKRTLIFSHLLREAKLPDKRTVLKIFKKKPEEKTQKEIRWVIQKMYEYKSIDYAQKLAAELKEKALKIFDRDLKFLSSQPARSHLETLANFILTRAH